MLGVSVGLKVGLTDKASAVDLSDPKFKLTRPTRLQILERVLESYNYRRKKKDMIERGFEVSGAKSTDSERF